MIIHKKKLAIGNKPHMEVQICLNNFIFWIQVLESIVKLYHLKNIYIQKKYKRFF